MKGEKNNTFFKINAVQTFTVTISVVGLIVAVANVWLVANLSSIKSDISVIAQKIDNNNDMDVREHNMFVTHAQEQQIIDRLDKISSRLDMVLSKLIK